MKILTRFVLPLGILLLGIACAGVLVATRGSAEQKAPDEVAELVTVAIVQPEAVPATVMATGTVGAARSVQLASQVAGRITRVSDELMPGGRFTKGQVVAQIETRDYALAVEAQRANVEQARLNLQIEQARQVTSKKEWALLGEDRPESDAPLALRKPQLQAAEVALAAAEATLASAELNLGRTTLRAPFNAVVVAEGVDEGQVIGVGTQVATLVGTDEVWVTVSLPVDRLHLIEVPGVSGDQGSPVQVTHTLGRAEPIVRTGQVARLVGQLDPQTRTAQLLVRVPEPMVDGKLPLMPGAYVDVAITGRTFEEGVRVPRVAVQDGDTVWVVDGDSRLATKTVRVASGDETSVIVTDGLAAGDKVVTSALGAPLVGTPVRIQDSDGSGT